MIYLRWRVCLFFFLLSLTQVRADFFSDMGICFNCGMMSNAWNMPMQMSSLFTGFGPMNFSNFFYPGAWFGGGMNGGFYPGGGHGFMGKPNIYVSGKSGAEVHVKVNLATDSNWLASAPSHGSDGWRGQLDGKGGMTLKGVAYPYLYYDYRLDSKKLQSRAGFCVTGDRLINRLVNVLNDTGFRPNEVKDFKDHWTIKMPPAKLYCVFPQEDEALKNVSVLEVQPKPVKVTRLSFMIVLDSMIHLSDSSFSMDPKLEWKPRKGATSNQTSSDSEGIEVREWGVGFLRDDK
jgi:hypothetical protein